MADRRTVLLFTRAPEAEARAKQLPVSEGARLFAGFLRGWEQRALDADAELLVVTPAGSEPALARLLPHATVAAQAGETFGARIESAFALAFARGSHAVLMVGGDGAPLDAPEVRAAFAHLEAHDRAIVLTPADDGGVNAIGFSAAAERPLEGIPWCTSAVCAQLRAEAARAGLSVLLTTPGYDLDSPAHVGALYRISRSERAWSAFRWLLHSILTASRAAAQEQFVFAARFAVLAHITRGPPQLSLLLTH